VINPHTTLIILTVIGALFVAVLGWIEAGEPFDINKFVPSMARAAIGGLVSAFMFQGIENPDIWLYLTAFLVGAGFDVTGHRISGAVNQIKE